MYKSVIIALSLTLAVIFARCSDEDDKYMAWQIDNPSAGDIDWNSSVENGTVYITVDVNANGGDFCMTCENTWPINTSFGYLGTYNNGWGEFTVRGAAIYCHFPKDNSARIPATEQLNASGIIDGREVNTMIRIRRTFGSLSSE